MTEQAERYDRIAEGYAQWWAPVLTPAVMSLLDRVDGLALAGSARLIDIGTGTGQLALFAGPALAGLLIAMLDGGTTSAGTTQSSPNMLGLGIAFSVKAISFRKILNETYAAAKIRRDIAATAVMPRNANRGTIILLHSDFAHRAIRRPPFQAYSVRARGKVP